MLSLTTLAQQWPVVNQEAKPGARWWWLGSAVDKENLEWNMRQYAEHGIGALEITPIYGVQGNQSNNIPYLTDKNCYMDISSAMPFLPPEKIHSLIRHYGAERLMFGSDYPMWDPVREYEAFMKLDLTEQERELILRKNAAKVFSIDVSALG